MSRSPAPPPSLCRRVVLLRLVDKRLFPCSPRLSSLEQQREDLEKQFRGRIRALEAVCRQQSDELDHLREREIKLTVGTGPASQRSRDRLRQSQGLARSSLDSTSTIGGIPRASLRPTPMLHTSEKYKPKVRNRAGSPRKDKLWQPSSTTRR